MLEIVLGAVTRYRLSEAHKVASLQIVKLLAAE